MQDRFTYSDDEIKALINCHYHRIVAYIRKVLGNQAPVCDAEDLLHDAVCLFIEKKVEVSSEKAPGYLFSIVRNLTLNHITRNKDKYLIREEDYAASAWDTLAIMDYEGRIDANDRTIDTIGIEEVIEHHETFSPRMRDIFYKSRIEGLTNREIAEELQISTRAVEQYLQQSVANYRRFFGFDSKKSRNN